ncbi:MAG: M23 family metallopeptidase [Candidatus Thorarchaeota archaeon]
MKVCAPADGEVVEVVNRLEDLYDSPFNMDQAIQEDTIKDIAGNYIIIKHNEHEFSHLYHLLKDSIEVAVSDEIERGHYLGKIGFSGAATLYSHFHYQLMDGTDFLRGNPLPCKFSKLTLALASNGIRLEDCVLDTGDFVFTNSEM